MQFLSKISILLSFFLLIFSCTEQNIETTEQTLKTDSKSRLGSINFKVTGSDEALPYFEKGMLLLYSFEYEDARTEFLKAQKIDSLFAMAYWGEAMTHNHSLWQRQERAKAQEALQKLAKNKEARTKLIQSEFEMDLFEATNILFGDGTKYDRDIAYKSFMEKLTEKYPKNNEVAALYALSLLGSSRNGRDEELFGKSAQIAQGILKENPQHPGALHYLIHSFDDPEHAHLAKSAADNYAKIAPDAAHALHMPSHIYAALGNWNDVVNSNIASWNAGVKRMERKELDNDARNYHALNWLQYGLLQRGETGKAAQLLRSMEQYTKEKTTKSARSYLLAMQAAQMVETNNWTSEFSDIEVEVKDLPITKKAGRAYLIGMKAYKDKDTKELTAVIKEMKKNRVNAQYMIGEKGFAMCSASGFANKPPNQLDIDMVHIMELELRACAAILTHDNTAVRDAFEKATAVDETLNYSFGPPIIIKPVHEAYGEWLLEIGQVNEALTVFEKSLKRHPRRLLSLQGLKSAAKALGNKSVQDQAEEQLAISLAKKEREDIL